MVNDNYTNLLKVLHHNVQSLQNKLYELSVLLAYKDMSMDILCFTEHWMCIDQIHSISLERYQLASNFSRSSRKGGGSCIFVINEIRAKEVNYLKDLAHEINFELSAVELMDLKTVVVCIYRSPDGDYKECLQNSEVVIYRAQASQKD
jgi:hypothetical protein